MGKKFTAAEYALKLLAVRPRTMKELRLRLRKRGYQQEEIEETLKSLRELNILDEEEFAESFIKGKMRKLYSKSWIKRELLKAGLPEDQVNTWLNEFYDETSVLSKLTEHAKHVFSQLHDLEKARRRIYAFVLRHGHSPSIARKIIDEALTQ